MAPPSSIRIFRRYWRSVCFFAGTFVVTFQLFVLHVFVSKIDHDGLITMRAASKAQLLSNPGKRGVLLTKKFPSLVDWKIFHGHSESHNSTLDGESLPGHFWNKRLYLLGSRLTTSYEEHVHDVHFDLFGLPLQWFDRADYGGKRPRCRNDPHGLRDRGIAWDYHRTESEIKLFCQIECRNDACKRLVPMQHVPLISIDGNQQASMHIWRCPVSHLLTKADLVEHSRFPRAGAEEAVRFHVWALESLTPSDGGANATDGGTNATDGGTNTTVPARPELVTSMDIPLSTAILGLAGPQIRTSLADTDPSVSLKTPHHPMPPSYLAQAPVAVSLVVAVYGTRAIPKLPEFVQHHRNLGFGNIIIAFDDVADSENIRSIRKMFGALIDEGIVAIFASGTPDLQCDCDLKQLWAYHACLYHNKGLAEFQAVWDVDEYWMPPPREGNVSLQTIEQERDSIPLAVRDDEIWQESKYSSSFSVEDVMTAIGKQREQRGCHGEQLCYHTFPSYTVHLKRNLTDAARGSFIRHDFEQRQELPNDTWKKSIAKTKYTYMGGIHIPGACRFNNSAEFTQDGDPEGCRAREFEQNATVFGAMHHFTSLFGNRESGMLKGRMQTEDEWPMDEYVQDFGRIVEEQLARELL